jgi:hypothetical protein
LKAPTFQHVLASRINPTALETRRTQRHKAMPVLCARISDEKVAKRLVGLGTRNVGAPVGQQCSHGGVSSEDTLEKAKWKHIDRFEKAWANGKFCEIAPKLLLANAEWRELFSNL